jgi:hypothetical protein
VHVVSYRSRLALLVMCPGVPRLRSVTRDLNDDLFVPNKVPLLLRPGARSLLPGRRVGLCWPR